MSYIKLPFAIVIALCAPLYSWQLQRATLISIIRGIATSDATLTRAGFTIARVPKMRIWFV